MFWLFASSHEFFDYENLESGPAEVTQNVGDLVPDFNVFIDEGLIPGISSPLPIGISVQPGISLTPAIQISPTGSIGSSPFPNKPTQIFAKPSTISSPSISLKASSPSTSPGVSIQHTLSTTKPSISAESSEEETSPATKSAQSFQKKLRPSTKIGK